MTVHLTTIHMLAGFAAELNEVEEKLHEALQTVVGIRSQVLYEISMASRPVDPEAPVAQGAPAPGKPPRPTEGGVAVTDGLRGPEEGGEGSADQCPGARVAGCAAVVHQADQALDGASLGEGRSLPDDPRLTLGEYLYDRVVDMYAMYGLRIEWLSRNIGLSSIHVKSVLSHARRVGHAGVRKMDSTKAALGSVVE